MRRKLFLTYILVSTVTVLVTVIFSWNIFNDHFYNQVVEESALQISLLEEILALEIKGDDFDFQEFALHYGDETDLRLTIIDMEGNVLADSQSNPATMENHKYRPEFKDALKGKEQSSLRFSNTIKTYSFYYAIPIDFDNFQGALRISTPVDAIESLAWGLANSVFVGLLIGLLLSLLVAYLFSRRLMAPIEALTKTAKIISEGDYDNKVYLDDQDEVGQLADAFNLMTFNLRKKIWEVETQNAELEAILTSMGTGLAAIDENYKIILSNEPFRRLLALEEDIEDKLFYEVSRNPILFNVIEKSVDDDEYVTEETQLRMNNEVKLLKISAMPIRSKSSKQVSQGVLLAVDDVTNLKKLENIRRDFVANVTHELKTPLTSIKGFVDALKKGDINDPEVSKRFLDIIDIESERLTLLIEDILSLSEIESMRLDKTNGDYHIGDIVEEVREILQHKANANDILLKVVIREDMKPIRCNKDRIKQLLINLLDNAIKYTEEGIVKIECLESRDGKEMLINVSDTGIGIKEEHLERLFERFYRVDKGRSRKLGGTGLGLSIVKHIVELYSGSIEVESTFGQGTTMKIRLPY